MPSVLRFLTLVFCMWALPAPALALELPPGLTPAGWGRVVEVVDGDTVVLADGREVRLVGIQAPQLPLGRPDFPTWPLAPQARQALAKLVLDREVTIAIGGRDRDRHGRVLAHLFRAPDGLWVQGEMLGQGLARVYTFADNRALAEALYARERAARAAGRGIWALDLYAILPSEEAERAIDRFALVEGTVVAVGQARGSAYLNFGSDWKHDFTAVIRPEALRVFTMEGIEAAAYRGRRIRVRGWVESWNGPLIEVTHPEQIEEVLE
ncbi:MAG: thermonuclease family protein [Rhodospirillales bacterium]|jgi:endonuclease YncB( thermonuclease family)|nr:thermonuclease family protein [Rhodospirillales bacterium]